MKKTNKLLHNIGLKIMAVIFAILLWLVSVNINNPMGTQSYRNIQVELKNTNLLTDAGKTYEVLDDTDSLTVTIRASRSVLEGISASDITATADFSELSFTNTVPIRLSVSNTQEREIQEIRGSIDMVKLEVENRIERQLVIDIVQSGSPADGYVVSRVSTTDGNALKISGPESLISQVEQAVVEADVNGLTESINITEPIKLLNADGEEITDNRIVKSISTTNLSVTILATKEVPISLSVTGEPAAGYVATGEISCAPETVTIAGRSNVLDGISEITIPEEELDLTGATEDVTRLIDIQNYLPEGVSLVNTSDEFNGKVAVTVNIEPLVDRTGELDQARILIQNVPEGYQVSLVAEEPVSIRLRGLQNNLNQVAIGELTGIIDVAAWMQNQGLTELEEGTVQMEVSVLLPDGVSLAQNVVASVNIVRTVQESTVSE